MDNAIRTKLEHNIIGVLLKNTDMIKEARERLSEYTFACQFDRETFEEMCAMDDEAERIDPTSLSERLASPDDRQPVFARLEVRAALASGHAYLHKYITILLESDK